MTEHRLSPKWSSESLLVAAGRSRRPGSPLNEPLVPASNFVLGTKRAYARSDGTPTWEALEDGVGALEQARAVAFSSGMADEAWMDRSPSRFGTVISFDVRGGAREADNVCSALKLIEHATSLGAVESTIERRAAISGQEHLPASLLRLSVGIENVEDLWADLGEALRDA